MYCMHFYDYKQLKKKNYIHWIHLGKQYIVNFFFIFYFLGDKEKFVTVFVGTQKIIQFYSREEGVIKRLMITIKILTRYVKLVKHSRIPPTLFLFHIPLKLFIRLQLIHLVDWDILLLSIGPHWPHII